MNYSYLDKNIGEVRQRIADAARACGRDSASVTLVAAVKYADTDEINIIVCHY